MEKYPFSLLRQVYYRSQVALLKDTILFCKFEEGNLIIVGVKTIDFLRLKVLLDKTNE
jgi:hypothetical protein